MKHNADRKIQIGERAETAKRITRRQKLKREKMEEKQIISGRVDSIRTSLKALVLVDGADSDDKAKIKIRLRFEHDLIMKQD